MLKRFTLQQQIFLFTLGLVVITLLLLWILVRPRYQQTLLNERATIVSQLQEYSLRATDRTIRDWLNTTNHITDQISANPAQAEALLRSSIQFNSSLMRVTLQSKNSGQNVELTRNSDQGYNYGNLPDRWIAARQDPTILVNWTADSTRAHPLFATKKLFQVNGEPLRATLFFNASRLMDDLFNLPVSGRHFESLIQKKGDFLLGQKSFSVPAEMLSNGTFSREHIIQRENTEWFLATSSMQSLPLWHVIGIDRAVILKPMQRMLFYSMLTGIGILLLMAGVSWYMSRKIEEPVSQLIDDVEHMNQLDFEHPVQEVQLPEFGKMRQTLERIRLTLLRYQKINVEKIILEEWKNKFLMTYSEDMIGITDDRGVFTFVNNHLARYMEKLGLDPDSVSKKEILNNNNITLSDANQTIYNPDPFRIRLDKSELVHTIDDEQAYYYDFQDVTILDDQNNPRGSLVVFHDVTQERKLDKKRNEMINIIVHELKNPATGVMGLAELMLQDPDIDEESRATFLNEIHHSGKRIHELVNRFLDVQRLEADTSGLDKEPVDLLQVTEEAIAGLRPQLQQKNLETDIVQEAEYRVILASRTLIFDAIQNLLSNAIKYGEPDRTIEIELSESDAGLSLSVTDYGYGISMEDQQKVFDKFYRIKNSQASNESGTGLGLPYVKEIVKKHGGSISLASNEEIGSRFTLNFPAEELDEVSQA